MTANVPANPLQALIKSAGAIMPATTGATEAFARRYNPSGTARVLLADVSASMQDVAWGGHRKIDILRTTLDGLQWPGPILAFATAVTRCTAIPEPSGSTKVDLALRAALDLNPAATLVISDGEPDDEAAALEAARLLPGIIDVLYIGPETNRAAMDFMQRLAKAGCGRFDARDLRRTGPEQLTAAARLMLPNLDGRR